MAKLLVSQPSCIFAVIIFVLLVFSVGLLVFVLKGQLHHENSLERVAVHAEGSTPPVPSPETALPDNQADAAGHTSQPEETPWLDFRLPKSIIPVHYDLLLHPDLDADTFSGSVNISMNVTAATRHFVVHAYRLSIRQVRVSDIRQKMLAVEKHFAYSPHEYFVVTMEEKVKPGAYKLRFEFGGTLNGTIIGFYESRYKNSKNETRAATAGSDVVQSGRPIFDDFFQHLWQYIGNNTANVVFQMVKRLWLIRIDQ
ncbi:glutamyl aminopeptidase [Trichonephila clavipes]|nr:glutamyl aminopeptidase [Trichonephila clavipes]